MPIKIPNYLYKQTKVFHLALSYPLLIMNALKLHKASRCRTSQIGLSSQMT